MSSTCSSSVAMNANAWRRKGEVGRQSLHARCCLCHGWETSVRCKCLQQQHAIVSFGTCTVQYSTNEVSEQIANYQDSLFATAPQYPMQQNA